MDWRDIEGWLTEAEGEQLRALADGRVVLELGSWKGRSTVAMAQVAEGVISVDHHRGDAHTGPADTLADFRANVERFGLAGKVASIVDPIESIRPDWFRRQATLAFVDASHDADSVERDARLALACLARPGVIAFHDWSYPTVREGAARCGLVEPAGVVDSLAWFEVAE